MINNKNDNKYAEKLKNHPIFQDQILRSDIEVKNLFETTFKFCKELIEGEILNELECYEEGDDICEDSNTTEKDSNYSKKKQKKYEEDNEEDCCKESNCNSKIICDDEDNDSDDLESDEDTFEENKSEYALLLSCMKLYKIFEHVLLKRYLYELISKNSKDDINDFEKAIDFFKNKKIILNEEEEQSIYLLQHLSDAISNSFLFKKSYDLDYTLLTDDEYMTNNIHPHFLLKTIEIANIIVQRIYNT